MNIEIEKKDFILTVNVSLTPRKSVGEMMSCDTGKILEWLKMNHPEYKIESIAQKPAMSLHNSLGLDRLKGKWLFSLAKPEEIKPPAAAIITKATKKKAPSKKTTKAKKPQKATKRFKSKTTKSVVVSHDTGDISTTTNLEE